MSEEKKKKRGKLIVVEGPDGVGKSTQVEKIMEYLANKPALTLPSVIYKTHEPGSILHPINDILRSLLFKESFSKSLHPDISGLLFFMDHLQHTFSVEELLQKGWWVVSDRWCYSQYAYNEIRPAVSHIATKLYRELEVSTPAKPDLVLCLNTEPEVLRVRLDKRELKREKDVSQKQKAWDENPDFLQKIVDTYNIMFHEYEYSGENWAYLVDPGNKTPDKIFEDLIQPPLLKLMEETSKQ